MAAYMQTDLFGWPFKEVHPEISHVKTMNNCFTQKDEVTTDSGDQYSSNFLKDLLNKFKEMPVSTASPAKNLITEITSEMATSGSVKSAFEANQEKFMGEGVTEKTTFMPTDFFHNITKLLGLDKMPMKNKFQASFEKITTLYNDQGYEDDGTASTEISGTTEEVINTSKHNGVFVHTLEEMQINNCYFYLITIVVILILLSFTSGGFLFYKKTKGGKGSRCQVPKLRDYNNTKCAKENDNGMVNI